MFAYPSHHYAVMINVDYIEGEGALRDARRLKAFFGIPLLIYNWKRRVLLLQAGNLVDGTGFNPDVLKATGTRQEIQSCIMSCADAASLVFLKESRHIFLKS